MKSTVRVMGAWSHRSLYLPHDTIAGAEGTLAAIRAAMETGAVITLPVGGEPVIFNGRGIWSAGLVEGKTSKPGPQPDVNPDDEEED